MVGCEMLTVKQVTVRGLAISSQMDSRDWIVRLGYMEPLLMPVVASLAYNVLQQGVTGGKVASWVFHFALGLRICKQLSYSQTVCRT